MLQSKDFNDYRKQDFGKRHDRSTTNWVEKLFVRLFKNTERHLFAGFLIYARIRFLRGAHPHLHFNQM